VGKGLEMLKMMFVGRRPVGRGAGVKVGAEKGGEAMAVRVGRGPRVVGLALSALVAWFGVS